MNNDIKFEIIELLKSRGAYSKSINGKQHYTRCPFCGDSRNLSHAHMSVMIDVDSDAPMVFRCLKCDTKGLFTESVLDELNLAISNELVTKLKVYNKKSMKIHNLSNHDCEKFTVPLYQDIYQNKLKLEYVNNRLGTEINFTKAKELKMVINVFDFMSHNGIESITGLSYSMMKTLHENYVGFLSTNNNCIVFRDITGNQKYRYFKVVLNDKNLNQDTFYSTPNSISLMYTNDIHIHIAEGIFDIISIQENLVKTKEKHYFYASCGFGSITILRYLIHHGINTGLNVHIYSDNDKSDKDHKKYLDYNKHITNWIDSISIHRNLFPNEKDYGVKIEKILDSSRKIK